MRLTKTSIAVLGFAAALCGCATASPPSVTSDNLISSAWHVVGLNGGSIYSLDMTIAFDRDGQAVGRSSCNTYRADYRLEGKRLSFQRVVATDRFCAQDLTEFEKNFFATLGDVESVSIVPSGSLVLYASENKRIIARRV